jgi:hypothetical protein
LQKKNCGGGVIGRGEGKYATKTYYIYIYMSHS